MRSTLLLAVFPVLLFVIISCKKSAGPSVGSVEGKWYEVKLNMYITDSTGVRLYDTTYLSPFTKYDYAQFNSDGTLIWGADHYYYLNMPGQSNAAQQIPPTTGLWNYTRVGNGYVLSTRSTLVNPGGFLTADTLSIRSDTLRWHAVLYEHDGIHQNISDSYFVRQ